MSDYRKIIGSAQDYILIVVGLACYALGYTAFILPEQVVTGGLTGVASLIYFQFGVPVAISNYALNILLLIFAYRIVGKTFVIRTVFGATGLSLLIGITQPLFHNPIVSQQPFMNVIIGALLCGFGIGLIFVHNGSSGGTDIIAAMVSKKSNVTVGRMIMYTDFIIIASSYLIFQSIEKIVYGLVFLFILSFITDFVINSNRQAVQFTIFSDKWEEIADAIIKDAHRGCTMVKGTGWYTKNEVTMLIVMCRKIESVTIFRIIKSIDKYAFITQSHVNGVYGKGFDNYKVKMKKNIADDTRHVHPQIYYDDKKTAQNNAQSHESASQDSPKA